MLHKCVFNPDIDLQETEQFGFVDLNEAFASGKIPASIASSESSFDAPAGTALAPSQIGGVPADVFDAMEMREALRSAAKRSADAKPEASSSVPSSSPEPSAT